MTRRRALLIAVPAVLVLVGVGAWLLWRRTAITPANAALIKEGMPRSEVEAVLGGPPRSEIEGVFAPDFLTGTPIERQTRLVAVRKATRLGAQGWYTERFAVWVAFDDAGRVTAIASCPARRFEEGILDKLRRWFRL